MSLEKAIDHKKEHRKQYYGCKAVDWMCRSHGGCPHCFSGRQYRILKRQITLADDEEYPDTFRHQIRNEKHKALK